MSGEPFEVRPFREGEEEAVNHGFNEVFGLARPVDEWRWKYTPEPEGRWILLAVDGGGEILAHYAALGVRFQAEGRSFRAGHIVDSYARRRLSLAPRGVFPATVERFFAEYGAIERLALLFGFPGTRHLRLGLAQMGYGEPVPVAYWTRPADAPVAPPSRLLWRRYRIRRGLDAAAVGRLWARSRERYPIAVVRDAAWLSRRYTDRPGVEYVHLDAVLPGRRTPSAWAALRVMGESVKWADLIWDGADPRALATLDREAVGLARGAGSAKLEMWLGGDEEAARAFAALGWRSERQPDDLHVTMRSFDPRVDARRIAVGWYYTLGDSDLV